MSKTITKEQLNKIADEIRDWPEDEKLRWEDVCKACMPILGYKPTRQALSRKKVLTNAYQMKTAQIKKRTQDLLSIAKPKSMSAAVEQILRLQKENEQLKGEVNLMAETAQRFIYNASLHGLTQAQLMQPLPKISRD